MSTQTNAFIYPEAIKARKFVNGLLPDLYVTVKPYNDQTWNGAVDRAKAYELTHQDQHAVNAYLNKFAPTGVDKQMENLHKAIQELTKQVQQLSTRNNGNRGYRTCPDSSATNPISITRRGEQSVFKLKGVPQGGESTSLKTIPSNLTLLETYPATRITRSKARHNPLQGTTKINTEEDENIPQLNQTKNKPTVKTVESKKTEIKKATTRIVKKKSPIVAPVNKMVEPYTLQQFFDQPANITNGQLLALNPKFGLTIAKQLRKPVVRKKDEEQEKRPIKKSTNNEAPEEEAAPEIQDLMQVNTARPNSDKTSALYCEALIKHIQFPLIVDSGSAGSIISLSLLKDLDMEITQASKTIMVNVNGERRRPLGAVTNIPLMIQGLTIPMDAIVTDADSYSAIVGNDWLRKTKAEVPHHIVSIEAPEIEAVDDDDEPIEESEEEYESDDEDIQEQMFCNTQFITQEKAQEIEEHLKEDLFIENEYFYQYKEEEIQRLLKAGLIVPSNSQWTSPVVVVEKKNGKKRLCVDYRKLNKVTKKDCYPLPRIDDMLETLSGSQWFSSLDLASGFWQVELDPEDREKSTFITRFGTYEFTVMPFGLCNAPATFQQLMDTVLRDIFWQFVIVYIDDINVGSKTFEEHLSHLEQVFSRLAQAGLKLSPEKCFFFKDKIPFLGHVVSRKGIHTDPEKLRIIKEFPIPENLTQLRGFIALASYYQKCVKNFSRIAEPLHRLLKKNIPYIWANDQQEAFKKLKVCLTTPLILAYPVFEKPFILYTDASTFALGAILAQKDDEKREHVITYAGRTLNRHERNYGITELECLAVVWSVKYFHHYLHGQRFTVITDHVALRYLMNISNPLASLDDGL
ncbi:gag-pol fusion protein [Rhizophagus irregularis DAOM 197198w]|uniref:Gag-pol fusion protein n=1 Tax=Rhizophagus irregularis (strain DAOM 197198w) TaxID=1432141 RepID=A0A015IZV2_RHIIW|nr:gag-pol fusion protein [Rhizophagus irregularis DAOM 197198w]